MNIKHKQSELHFNIFPKHKLKVLIDTGSTRSFINPRICKQILFDTNKKRSIQSNYRTRYFNRNF